MSSWVRREVEIVYDEPATRKGFDFRVVVIEETRPFVLVPTVEPPLTNADLKRSIGRRSLVAVGKELGVSQVTLRNWLNGTKRPSFAHVPALLRFCGHAQRVFDEMDWSEPEPVMPEPEVLRARFKQGLKERMYTKRYGGWEDRD